jgi:hypothetical protein
MKWESAVFSLTAPLNGLKRKFCMNINFSTLFLKWLYSQIVMKTKNIICSFIRIVKPGVFEESNALDYC